jgi:hypothetical protein
MMNESLASGANLFEIFLFTFLLPVLPVRRSDFHTNGQAYQLFVFVSASRLGRPVLELAIQLSI